MAEMKLLPCPFCGDAAHLTSGGPLNEYVKCFGCGVSTDDSSKERAIAAWNRRPPLLEAAKGAVAAWERLYRLFPLSSEVEDAEFEEFMKLRSEINKAEGRMPWEAGAASKAGA